MEGAACAAGATKRGKCQVKGGSLWPTAVGAITTTYTYGPFGATTVNGASTNPVQFTGRENDGNNLYYYRARYYNPSHGRFLAEDPLEFGGGDLNLYAYVFNNPINFVDPFGEAVKIPPFAKKCVVGMLKAVAKIAGLNLALPNRENKRPQQY